MNKINITFTIKSNIISYLDYSYFINNKPTYIEYNLFINEYGDIFDLEKKCKIIKLNEINFYDDFKILLYDSINHNENKNHNLNRCLTLQQINIMNKIQQYFKKHDIEYNETIIFE